MRRFPVALAGALLAIAVLFPRAAPPPAQADPQSLCAQIPALLASADYTAQTWPPDAYAVDPAIKADFLYFAALARTDQAWCAAGNTAAQPPLIDDTQHWVFGNASVAVAAYQAAALAVGPSPVQPQTACHAAGGLPDPICTPGAADPAVTQSNIATTICVAGYSASVRPPTSYTEPLKLRQMAAYGYDPAQASLYEEDHLISLELGGAPRAEANLWPETWDATAAGPGAHTKDTLENALHAMVCAGTLDLGTAQAAIAGNWIAAYQQYVGAQSATPTPTAPAAPTATPVSSSGSTCNDGTHSPSTGPGTCSGHGGVAHSP